MRNRHSPGRCRVGMRTAAVLCRGYERLCAVVCHLFKHKREEMRKGEGMELRGPCARRAIKENKGGIWSK